MEEQKRIRERIDSKLLADSYGPPVTDSHTRDSNRPISTASSASTTSTFKRTMTMYDNLVQEQTNDTLSKKYDSAEDAIRIGLREVGMSPKDNAFDYDLMNIDGETVLSPSKNTTNWVARLPFVPANNIKLEKEYSDDNHILFFMDGSPPDLLYVDFSSTGEAGENPYEGEHECILRQLIIHYNIIDMLTKIKLKEARVAHVCKKLIEENNKIGIGDNNKISFKLTEADIAKIINKEANPTVEFTGDETEITELVKLFTKHKINKFSGEEIPCINDMKNSELRAQLIEHITYHQIPYGWGNKPALDKIQSPKALFAKNALFVALEFSLTNTIVGLDISYLTKEKAFNIDKLDAEIDLDILVLMSLAALYTAYYFRNVYIEQETRRFKDASPEVTGSREVEARAKITQESNVFSAQAGVVALLVALLSSNDSFKGIHYEGMLMAAGVLAVALPLVTYAAGKASKTDDDKRSKLWGEMICGFVIGALSYIIAASMAPVTLPKELDWFNCAANTGRVLSFGFGLAGYYGAVRCMSSTVASDAVEKRNEMMHS